MPARRRKSGFRSVPPRAANERIELWRAPNKHPVSVDPETGEVPNPPATTWDKDFNLVDSGTWAGGWSHYVDGDKEDYVRINRKIVYEGAETQQEFEEREFLFVPQVSLSESSRVATALSYAANSWRANTQQSPWVERDIEFFFGDTALTTQGNDNLLTQTSQQLLLFSIQGLSSESPLFTREGLPDSVNAYLDAIDETDSVLKSPRPLGDFPALDTEDERDKPWNEREFIAPYGFDDEALKDLPPGVQIVGDGSARGLENYGLVPASPEFRSLNENDLNRETQLPVRARRGIGSDYWDWLPPSTRHVFFLRQPYVEFPNFEQPVLVGLGNENPPLQVFEEWKTEAEPAGDLPPAFSSSPSATPAEPWWGTVPPGSPPSAAQWDACLPTDRRSFEALGTKRALIRIPDQAPNSPNTSFERTPTWTTLADMDATFPPEPGIETHRRASSLLASGGLWIGAAQSSYGPLPGDNFVMKGAGWEQVKKTLRSDEWMLEIGFSCPLPSVDLEVTGRNGEGLERFLVSTSPEGGLPAGAGQIKGEIRPKSGFAVSTQVIRYPLFPSEYFYLATRIYFVHDGVTRIANDLVLVPRNLDLANFSGRICLSVRGGKASVCFEPYGFHRVVPAAYSDLTPSEKILVSLATYDNLFTSLASIDVSDCTFDDATLVIPSIRSTRVSPSSAVSPWQRSSDGSSRLLLNSEWNNVFKGIGALEDATRADFQFGHTIGGLAFHDSVITDHNDLERPARRMGGTGWSAWLAPSTPNNLFDLVGDVMPLREEDIFSGTVSLGKFSAALPWANFQEANPGERERSLGTIYGGITRGRRKLAEGALCAQWKGTPRWNGVIREPASPDGRPWGFPCGKVVETVSNLKAAPVAELNPVTGSGLPFWSTWGLRFGARRVGSSSFSSTLRSETVPTLSALLDTQLGIGARLTSNWNASVWTTLFSVDDLPLISGEKIHNIWKIHNFAALEWVVKSAGTFIRATVWRYDTPQVMEVRVTREMTGLPLHVNFGAFIFRTPLNPGTPSTDDHFGYWLCVDSPDDPTLDKRIKFDEVGFDPNDPSSDSTFKVVVEQRTIAAPNPPNTQVNESSWVQMGQPAPESNLLEIDYCVGGAELRRWKWNHVKTSGGWEPSAISVADSRRNLGRSEPFFDSINPKNDPESLIRLPLIREYCKARSNSLWGYTGRARILPETPSLSSIDGVGVDLFLDRKWSLSPASDTFLLEAFPSLFLTRQTLAYVPERVAALRLESSDRPQVWECFDRRLARTKFEGVNSLCQPPSGKSYMPQNQTTTSGALNVFWNLPDRQEAVQFLRRFWIPRGITSPVDPIPEFGVLLDGGELSREDEFTYAIFTPGTDGQGILYNSLSEELGLIQSALSGVVDRFAPPASLRLPTSLDLISQPSNTISLDNIGLGLQARAYGAIELQRLRNETYPRVREDGSNTLLVPVNFYRQGDKPEVVRSVMQHPDYSDPVPFPTFSLRFQYADDLDVSEDPLEVEAQKHETNVLGNLSLERQSTLWGFCQTPSDAFPTPFRIVRENLDLEDDQASSFVWRRQRGGRQLLRSPGGTGKAFLGKGRRNWVRALWASVSDENFAFDTVPPNPFATNTFALPPLAFEHTEKIPKSVQGNERLTRAWRTKFMSRALREEISGSPSPFNSGLDGLNPFPTRRTTAVSSGYLGFPVWTPLQSLLAREFALSLQLGLFPQGELDEIFEGRRKSPWIELTGSQGFALWNEWARVHGLWGKRGVFDSMSPFLAYPLLSLPFSNEPRFQGRALVRKFNEVTRFRPVSRSPRAKTDAVNLFEAALEQDEITGTGELLLLDRFTTFDDDYPVVNSGFNFRFVRNIAGRLEAALDLKIAGSSPNPGTVNPLALQSGLTRYRAEGKGFLRNTLASQRTSNALLKLWYGTGDNLGCFDYTSWWKTLEFFQLDRGGTTPALIPLSEGTEIEQLGNIGLYEAQVNAAGGAFIDPNASPAAGGNFTTWNVPVENRRFVNSVRPYGPNIKGYDWSRSQVWTRDVKLQTRRRIHEHWSLRHSFPQELMENVRITPRGWRYGLSNVTPTGRRWAINPRHWGYLNDLASLPSTAEIGNVDTFPVVVRILEDPQSKNSTLNFQSFTPWSDWDDLDFKAEVEGRAAEPPSLPDPISREDALEFIRTTRILEG